MDREPALQWIREALDERPTPLPPLDDDGAADVARLAIEEGIGSYLSHRLHRKEAGGLAVAERLKTHLQLQAMREMLVDRELGEVSALLDQHALRHIVFKGTALAHSVYPEPYLRERCDTDILFASKEHTLEAWRLLRQRGFERANVLEGDLVSSQFTAYRELAPNVACALDLHWRLSNSEIIAREFAFEDLLERAAGGSRGARYPAPEDALVIACLHRAYHHADDIADRLIWLVDIALLAAEIESRGTEPLLARLRGARCATLVAEGLGRAAELIGSSAAERLRVAVTPLIADADITAESFRTTFERDRSQFRGLGTWREKLAFLAEHAFPAPEYVMEKYRVRNPLWLPLLYAHRGIAGTIRRLRQR